MENVASWQSSTRRKKRGINIAFRNSAPSESKFPGKINLAAHSLSCVPPPFPMKRATPHPMPFYPIDTIFADVMWIHLDTYDWTILWHVNREMRSWLPTPTASLDEALVVTCTKTSLQEYKWQRYRKAPFMGHVQAFLRRPRTLGEYFVFRHTLFEDKHRPLICRYEFFEWCLVHVTETSGFTLLYHQFPEGNLAFAQFINDRLWKVLDYATSAMFAQAQLRVADIQDLGTAAHLDLCMSPEVLDVERIEKLLRFNPRLLDTLLGNYDSPDIARLYYKMGGGVEAQLVDDLLIGGGDSNSDVKWMGYIIENQRELVLSQLASYSAESDTFVRWFTAPMRELLLEHDLIPGEDDE